MNDIWSVLSGLLGPTPEQLAALRQQYGVPDAEVPSIPVRLGRGLFDLWEPAKQTYLNLTDPNAAAAYQQQRAEDERLYERGLVAGDPSARQPVEMGTAPNGEPMRLMPPPLKDTDVWRMIGRTAPFGLGIGMLAPAAPLAQSMFELGGTANLYEALEGLRQKLGLAPWLETPQFWR